MRQDRKKSNMYLHANVAAQNIVKNVYQYFEHLCNVRFPGLGLNVTEVSIFLFNISEKSYKMNAFKELRRNVRMQS